MVQPQVRGGKQNHSKATIIMVDEKKSIWIRESATCMLKENTFNPYNFNIHNSIGLCHSLKYELG